MQERQGRENPDERKLVVRAADFVVAWTINPIFDLVIGCWLLWFIKSKIRANTPEIAVKVYHDKINADRINSPVYKKSVFWRDFERFREKFPISAAATLLLLVHEYPIEASEQANLFIIDKLSHRRVVKRILKGHLVDMYKFLSALEGLPQEKRSVLEKITGDFESL